MATHSGQTLTLFSEKKDSHKEFESSNKQLLSHNEMICAVELLFRRMEDIDLVCKNGFPLYATRKTGQWTISTGGSWVGGFWSALWWLRSHVNKSIADQHKASDICQRLASKLSVNSINRSLIYWYGASLGDQWFKDAKAHRLVRESILSITATYNSELNCIPLGSAMGGGERGNQCISVDSLAAIIQLLNSSELPFSKEIARFHTDTLLAACFNDQGAFHATAYFSQAGFQSNDEAGVWSRGQAWGMLGLCRAAAQWGEPYLTNAQSACEYWKFSRPDSLPPSRLGDLHSVCDPSSTVIASLAILSLADLIPNGDNWRIYAHQQITAIVRSQYFITIPASNNLQSNQPGNNSGSFWGCCYKINRSKEELVETIWGNFFLAAALCMLIRVIKSADI